MYEVIMPPLTKKDPTEKYIDDAMRAMDMAKQKKKKAQLRKLELRAQYLRAEALGHSSPFPPSKPVGPH